MPVREGHAPVKICGRKAAVLLAALKNEVHLSRQSRIVARPYSMKLFPRLTVFLLTLLLAFASAQNAAPAQHLTGVAAEQEALIGEMTAKVDVQEKSIGNIAQDDAKLVEARLVLEGILSQALTSGVSFRPRLAEIGNRLEQLGPAPGKDQPAESDRVRDERQALVAEKANINVVLGKAEDLSVRVNGLLNKISDLRRDLFTSLLTKRYQLQDAIGKQVVSDISAEGQTLRSRVGSSFRFALQFKPRALLLAALLSLIAAVIIQVGGGRLFGRLFYRDPVIAHPGYINRLSVAFWSSLLPAVALGLCFLLAGYLFDYGDVFTGDTPDFLSGLMGVIFVGFMVNRIGRAVFSPDLPNWQLIRIEPRPARTLIWLMTSLGLVVGLSWLTGFVSDRLGSPLSVTIVKSLIAAVISGMLILAISRIKPFRNEDGSAQGWPAWFRLILYVLGFGSILAALAGYISLAQFVSTQIVLTGALLTIAYIGLLASGAISEEGGFAKTTVGRYLKQARGTDDARLDQLGVLTSVVINVLIVALFLPFLLFQWGFKSGDIAAWLTRAANGFQIGSFSFSPFAILTGIIVFAAGYALTRWFQRWLDGTVMARGRVDVGVRNSIRAIVGYAGLALAGLVAISAAGLNLSNLALIAGGLSLGIGFGLQNVVSNFVSGLILLVERPFKAGDWVVAGDVSGTVKKISVRATEIETFQRQSVILPNSVLINGAVGNWTHRNRMGRVDIPIGVEHGSDAEHVHEVLLGIARNHPLVLKNPEPFVLFSGFTETAINFEIRVFLADIGGGSIVQNDMRFAILRAFKQEGIDISHTPRPAPAPASPAWTNDDDHAEAKLIDRLAKRANEPANRTGRSKRRPDPS